MPSLSDVRDFQSAVDDLSTLGIAELVAFWRSLDLGDALASTAALKEFMPELLAYYGPMAAELGASFYEAARADVITDSFSATLSDAPTAERAQRLVGWAVGPLFSEKPDRRKALSLLTGGTQREIANTSRETVESNGEFDPSKPKYARHASANACAFCAIMATRGAVYAREESAIFTRSGKLYHSRCSCVPVPVFEGEEYQPAEYVAEWESAYQASRKVARAVGEPQTLRGLLPFMRTIASAS